MYKVLVTIASGAVLLTGSIVSAQAYYPSYSTSNCTVISRDLSVGSRGADVSDLQRFLVAQNYPGGGSWMVTGFYGQATAAAVRNYQSQHGIPSTGAADSSTRASIAACGSYNPINPIAPSYPSYPTYPTAPTYPTYPMTPIYPTTPPVYPGVGTPYITSLSTNSTTQGTSVTIYGTNLQYGSAIVRIGSTNAPVTNVSNSAITFTVPALTPGSYQVSVTTYLGTSNSMPLTVIPAYPCTPSTTYPFNNGCGGCSGYGFGTNICPGGALSLSFLAPNSGAINSQVTIYGSGFSSTGNSVRFGQGVIANLNSLDGTTLTFTVPNQLTGFGGGQVYLGTYYVSVTNASGHSSNALPFTVTSLAPTGAPSITGISGPNALANNTTGTWTLSLNNETNTYTSVVVNWGDNQMNGGSTATQTVYNQGSQALSFSRAYAVSGTYTITFTATSASGQSNVASASVVVSGTASGSTTLSYLSPQSGRVGTQILIVGGGFSPLENTIHFGIGGTQHVVSNNGTTIYYTVPSYISTCDLATFGCSAPAQLVMPGTYPIYISNQNGTTSSVNFTVVQ